MYVTWQMIIAGFVAVCVGFSSVCAAVVWAIKIVKGLKKPSIDVNEKLDNDNKRIKALEENMGFILKAISLLLQDDLVILKHLRTSNNTGKMEKQENKVQDFLTDRIS